MLRLFTAALTTIVIFSGHALAQQGGTEQERQACAPDVKKYCAAVFDQGDLVILSCLQQNRSKISQSCNRVLVDHGQ
ncbi:hypothetical protein AB8B21_17690 [Tardiphaga sp. 866_E4_N2_1]|uniref:hypothetical protein n=1 Tax=unclassified Tardiphaga TaxID=2631404 RepID=UPI003F212EB1